MKTKLLSNGLMVLDDDTHLSKWIEQQGRLCTDGTVPHFILPHLKPGDWVADVGASLGDHTAAYAEAVGPAGKVFAFEPHPLSCACLIHNMAPYKQVSVWHWPLSDRPEKLLLHESPNVGASHLAPLTEGTGQHATVSVTLDSIALARLNYMKVDVEGMELKVFRGAEQTLRKFKPLLFVELQKHHLARNGTSREEVISFLGSLGYKLKFLDPSHGLHMEQVDVFFKPI